MLASENVNEKRTTLVMNLVKGKEYANQLQAVLQKPYEGQGLAFLAEELAQKVLRTFTDSLAVVSSCGSGETMICRDQIAASDHLFSASSGGDQRFRACNDTEKKPDQVKDRRGGYKRRRAAEPWVIVSPTLGDGYTWRKYGQKEIQNSKFPRCYYRCTHKYDQGCQAIKQVQKIDQQEPIMFQTTYFGHHTCRDTTQTSRIISDPSSDDAMESKLLISFQGNIHSGSNPSSNCRLPSVKQESSSKEEMTQSDMTDNKSSINSSVWQDLVASSSSEPVMEYSPKMESYHEEVVSGVYTGSGTTSLDIKNLSEFADFSNHDFPF